MSNKPDKDQKIKNVDNAPRAIGISILSAVCISVTPPVTHEETIDSGTGAVSDEMDFGEEPTYEFDSDSGEVEFNPQEDEQLEASEPKPADASKAIGDLLGSLMG